MDHFHVFEHFNIIADPQRLAAFSTDIFQIDPFRFDLSGDIKCIRTQSFLRVIYHGIFVFASRNLKNKIYSTRKLIEKVKANPHFLI